MNKLSRPLLGQAELSKKSDFCQLQQGFDRQPKCDRCRKLELLIQYWITRQNRGARLSTQSKPELIHTSYAELDHCSQQCITCRTIRRGFLINQPTKNDMTSLASYPDMVWATIVGTQLSNMSLHISLSRTLSQRTVITLSQQNTSTPTEITLSVRADLKSVYDQDQGGAKTCHMITLNVAISTGPRGTQHAFCVLYQHLRSSS